MFKEVCNDLSEAREKFLEQVSFSVLECQLKMGNDFWIEFAKHKFDEEILSMFPLLREKLDTLRTI